MDRTFMEKALGLARNCPTSTYPNPSVGAVIVKDGVVIGEGWHHGPGLPHAEVEAINACRVDPKGGTIYVTLEPCNHWGKTPPCTEAILKAGIARVVFAVRDPNPRVAGGGALRLKDAGVIVEEGLGKAEALEINRGFFYHSLTGRPWVIMKSAASLDGKISDSKGESKWITGEEARRFVHWLRSRVGAVLIGSGTLAKDNPRLDNRLSQPVGRQPWKVLLDSELKISLHCNLVAHEPKGMIVFCTGRADKSKENELIDLGVRVIRQEIQGRVDLYQAMETMGSIGIQSLLVEGGSQIFASFLQAGLVNEYFLFYAPFFLGGEKAKGIIAGMDGFLLKETPRLLIKSLNQIEQDLLIHAYKEEPAKCLRV